MANPRRGGRTLCCRFLWSDRLRRAADPAAHESGYVFLPPSPRAVPPAPLPLVHAATPEARDVSRCHAPCHVRAATSSSLPRWGDPCLPLVPFQMELDTEGVMKLSPYMMNVVALLSPTSPNKAPTGGAKKSASKVPSGKAA